MGEFRDKNKSVMIGDGVNWDATSHQQLWEWFSQPELRELQAWADTFNDKVVGHFQAAADKVEQALKAAGVVWEGTAADAMQGAVSPLAGHALRARDAASQVGGGTMGQFVFAKEVAAAMPPPQPAPDQNVFIAAQDGDLVQHFQDVAAYEAAENEAAARARDLVKTYDGAAGDAAGSLPRFEPAPAATVSRVEPGDVIEVGDPQPGDGGPPPDTGPGDPRLGDPGGSDPTQGGGTPGSGTPSPGDGVTTGQGFTPSGADGTPLGPPPASIADTPRPGTTAPVTGFLTGGPGPGPGIGTRGPGGGTRGPGVGGQPGGQPGRQPGGQQGRQPGGQGGQQGGQGGQPGGRASGPRVGVRGGLVEEGPVTARSATATGRGGGNPGMAPVGGGRGREDEDKERNSPEYLRDYHDDFWDDTPPVAPAVIGDEDDDD